MSRRHPIRTSVHVDDLHLPSARGQTGYRAAFTEAVWLAARFAQALWVRRAQDLNIRRSGAYLRGIQEARIQQVRGGDTPTGVDITLAIVNNAPHASVVERGHPAYSLPRKIDWSKAPRGKNGPYLRIPFRHAAYQTASQRERSGMPLGTLKTMMPPDVHARARRLPFGGRGPGSRLRFGGQGPHTRVGPSGVAVEAQRGARTVQGRDAAGRRLTNPAWKSPRWEGLFKAGRKGHVRYMTIRTITPNSKGWNIPAQQGRHVARQVTRVLSGGVGHDRFRRYLVDALRPRGVAR